MVSQQSGRLPVLAMEVARTGPASSARATGIRPRVKFRSVARSHSGPTVSRSNLKHDPSIAGALSAPCSTVINSVALPQSRQTVACGIKGPSWFDELRAMTPAVSPYSAFEREKASVCSKLHAPEMPRPRLQRWRASITARGLTLSYSRDNQTQKRIIHLQFVVIVYEAGLPGSVHEQIHASRPFPPKSPGSRLRSLPRASLFSRSGPETEGLVPAFFPFFALAGSYACAALELKLRGTIARTVVPSWEGESK
jgi:hypothetical protein